MRRWIVLPLVLCFAAAAPQPAAAKFDGSAPLLCVPVTIMECDPSGKCERETAEGMKIPNFLKVSVKDKMIGGTEAGSPSAPIHSVANVDGRLILQGGQEGRGWTIVISEATGKLSAAVSHDDVGFVIFGACTPL